MKYWILPSNRTKFNMEAALEAQGGFVDWRCKKLSVGDVIFMYQTQPDGFVKYMFEVVKVNFSLNEAFNQERFWLDISKYNNGEGIYNRLKLINVLNEKKLTVDELHKHGINGNIQSKRSCPQETLDYILGVK